MKDKTAMEIGFGPVSDSQAQIGGVSTSGSAPPAIEITGLTKNYGGSSGKGTSHLDLIEFIRRHRGRVPPHVTALNGVSLRVEDGEVFGLLGPNGAGKTTLIKIMSTLLLPDGGRVLIQGNDVVRRPREALKHLQTVLAQATGFEIRLSGRRNLEFYAALYGLGKSESAKRINELLAFTGLENKADLEFQKFSTGMARRLLVARALLSNASILVFDEPTSSLDPVSALEFRRMIKNELAVNESKTVFLATHNLQEAQQICDRVALIKSGKIILSGTPAEIRRLVANTINMEMVLSVPSLSQVEDFLDKVRRINGVTDVRFRVRVADFDLEIEGTKDVDYSALFLLIKQYNLRIMSLEASEPSLEEAFLSIVGKGTK